MKLTTTDDQARKIPGHNLLTHSRITCWLTCRRKHHIEYVLGMRREMSPALRMGDIWHDARHVLNMTGDSLKADDRILTRYRSHLQSLDEERRERFWLEQEILRRLLQGWVHRGQDESRDIVVSELAFEQPLRNPKTGRASRIWRLAGKMDAILRLSRKGLALEELKTTSDPIGPDSKYWKALRLDAQVSRYMLAALGLGYPIKTVMYDVAHKPGTRPKMVNKKRETVLEYSQRLAVDIAERPEFYFARVEVPRLRGDIEAMRTELWQIGQDMRDAERKECHYRNSEACIGKKYTCEHLDACSNHTDLVHETPDGYHRLTTSLHPELELTNATETATAE